MKFSCALLLACFAVPGNAVAGNAAAAEPFTPAKNLAIIRQQIEVMNRGDWQAAVETFASDTRNFGEPTGKAVIYRIFEDIWTTFPDWHTEIEDIRAVGDSVVVRALTSGTHQGVGRIPVNGGMLVGVPATHKHFKVAAIHWYKMKQGKIVDHYATRNDLSMMQQLGLLPPPQPFDWDKLVIDANKP